MRIGFSTSVIQRGKTGIAQHVFALLRALDQARHDHSFVLFTLEEDRELFAGLGDRFEIMGVPERFRPAVRNIMWHQAVLPRLAGAMSLDLVHVPSYRRLPARAPCARVATIHDLAPFRVAAKYDFARMFYGRVVVKALARRQDSIIAVSECTARDLEQFFTIERGKIRVIHNGIDHGRFRPLDRGKSAELCAARHGLTGPFLLYVARLEHPAKNHVRLIEAFERFKRSTGSDWLLALGGSDWHGAEAIHERIAASPFRASIRALGFVSDADLPSLYSAAEAFCYPSLYEGFGMPPLEAMACGCPVISSERGSLGEVVGDAALLIDPEDAADITAALSQLHGDTKKRRDLVQRGLKRAGEFSWEKAARDTLEVYAQASAASARRGRKRRTTGRKRHIMPSNR